MRKNHEFMTRCSPTLAAHSWLVLGVFLCIWAILSGYFLSAAGFLTATGYFIAAMPGVMLGSWVWKRLGFYFPGSRQRWRRFRRPMPCLFAVLCVATLAGGLLHDPSNYDALSYRLPRVFDWLSEHRWFWIDSPDSRMNNRPHGQEWLLAPLAAWGFPSRMFFLPNWLALLALPSAVFLLLRHCGLPHRVCWQWMWILPSGYGYVLQAGGLGNDLLGAVLAVLALAWALVAGRTQQISFLGLSMLAMAIATCVKITNLPLVLPYGVALIPGWKLALRHPGRIALIAILCIPISLAPWMALNWRHSGSWDGGAAPVRAATLSKAEKLAGNAVLLAAQNFSPPILPSRDQTTRFIHGLLPRKLLDRLTSHFEAGFLLGIGELQIEESAALGFAVCSLLGLFAILSLGQGRQKWLLSKTGTAVSVATWIILFAIMASSTSTTVGRFFLGFYPMLALPLLGFPGGPRVSMSSLWRWLACAGMASSLIVLALTPARPLVPVQAVLSLGCWMGLPESFLLRAGEVYRVYQTRSHAMSPLRRFIPPGTRDVWIVNSKDNPIATLWMPLGALRVRHIHGAAVQALAREQPSKKWVILSEPDAHALLGWKSERDIEAAGWRVAGRETLTCKVSRGPEIWFVLTPSSIR